MPEFIFLAAVMTVVAVLLVAIPLWRGSGKRGPGSNTPGPDEEAISVKLFHHRLVELKQDVANGIVPEEDFEQARTELERQLLDDSAGAENQAGTENQDAPGCRLPRARGRWAAGALVLMIPLFGLAVYNQVGGKPWDANNAAPQAKAAMGANVQQMVEGLARRLRKNPDNGKGWLMLGRSYLVMGEYDKAAQALARARQVLGDTPETLTDDAEALAMANSGHSFAGEPEKLLQKALVLDPGFDKALWLSGVAAARAGDDKSAIGYWQTLLKQQTPGSQTETVIRKTIAQAHQRLAQAGADQATSAPATASVSKSVAANEAVAAAIKVQVSLAPGLAGKVSPDAPVFIFARPLSGSPLPVAVVRRQVKDLPLSVVLDDHTGMMQGNNLSSFKRVSVDARISSHGSALAQSGDLEAQAQTVMVSANGQARLVIDHVLSGGGGN